MSTVMGLGIVALVFYLPVACLITLGLLAVWNKWRPPTLWQVLVATALVGFIPALIVDLVELMSRVDDPLAGYRMWLAFVGAVFAYLPILVPAILWVLQRRGEDGSFSRVAQTSGSLLVAYIVLVILVIPAAFLCFVFFFSRE